MKEVVWIQNLKGFIKGTFPADERWKKIFIEQLDRLNEDELARLRRMVERRDEFIIANGLWDAFKEVRRDQD